MTTTRKIVQLAVTHQPYNQIGIEDQDRLYALCNDGSVWRLMWATRGHPETWDRLPDIPQDAPVRPRPVGRPPP
jgi:hypothetical protein